MIKGIGIDTVEISRFADWHTYSIERLQRIFTLHEIEYCLQEQQMSAARFAARFTAKEALYKALCSSLNTTPAPFATVAPLIEVYQQPGQAPKLLINWEQLADKANTSIPLDNKLICYISLTHTQQLASAFVLLEG